MAATRRRLTPEGTPAQHEDLRATGFTWEVSEHGPGIWALVRGNTQYGFIGQRLDQHPAALYWYEAYVYPPPHASWPPHHFHEKVPTVEPVMGSPFADLTRAALERRVYEDLLAIIIERTMEE